MILAHIRKIPKQDEKLITEANEEHVNIKAFISDSGEYAATR